MDYQLFVPVGCIVLTLIASGILCSFRENRWDKVESAGYYDLEQALRESDNSEASRTLSLSSGTKKRRFRSGLRADKGGSLKNLYALSEERKDRRQSTVFSDEDPLPGPSRFGLNDTSSRNRRPTLKPLSTASSANANFLRSQFKPRDSLLVQSPEEESPPSSPIPSGYVRYRSGYRSRAELLRDTPLWPHWINTVVVKEPNLAESKYGSSIVSRILARAHLKTEDEKFMEGRITSLQEEVSSLVDRLKALKDPLKEPERSLKRKVWMAIGGDQQTPYVDRLLPQLKSACKTLLEIGYKIYDRRDFIETKYGKTQALSKIDEIKMVEELRDYFEREADTTIESLRNLEEDANATITSLESQKKLLSGVEETLKHSQRELWRPDDPNDAVKNQKKTRKELKKLRKDIERDETLLVTNTIRLNAERGKLLVAEEQLESFGKLSETTHGIFRFSNITSRPKTLHIRNQTSGRRRSGRRGSLTRDGGAEQFFR